MLDTVRYRSRIVIRYRYVNRHVRKHSGQKFSVELAYAPPRARLGHLFRLCHYMSIAEAGVGSGTRTGFVGGYVFGLWALGRFGSVRSVQNFQLLAQAKRAGRAASRGIVCGSIGVA